MMKTIALILCCTLVVRAFPQGYDYSAPGGSAVKGYAEPPETPGHADEAFQFAYAVASPEHGTYHGHQSTRDQEGQTSGSYYELAPDGNWRQTIYADKGLGFQAISNQRPAGSPPPQVSAVNYQIFVHPGATAVSASGGGPIDGGNFNFPTLDSAISDIAAPLSSVNAADFGAAPAQINVGQQFLPAASENTGFAGDSFNAGLQFPGGALNGAQTSALGPVNFDIRGAQQGPTSGQALSKRNVSSSVPRNLNLALRALANRNQAGR
ncbi:uncharacterized protein [Macrobrachium rosenbergii]|uniref:uncharacterized protein n=1 Tax=Macrobrachium rosenbergii TaxID=79674 RepID=UPI0034D561AB